MSAQEFKHFDEISLPGCEDDLNNIANILENTSLNNNTHKLSEDVRSRIPNILRVLEETGAKLWKINSPSKQQGLILSSYPAYLVIIKLPNISSEAIITDLKGNKKPLSFGKAIKISSVVGIQGSVGMLHVGPENI